MINELSFCKIRQKGNELFELNNWNGRFHVCGDVICFIFPEIELSVKLLHNLLHRVYMFKIKIRFHFRAGHGHDTSCPDGYHSMPSISVEKCV